MNAPERILVIRRRAIGDVLVSLDVLRALKDQWPHAHLTFVVDPAAESVVRGCRFIDEVLVYNRKQFSTGSVVSRLRATLNWLAELRAKKPDLVLDLLGTPQTAVWTAWSRAATRVGPRRRKRSWAYNVHVEPENRTQFAGERFLDWVRALELDPGPWRPHAPAELITAPAESHPLVILNASATWSAKAWPVDHFGALARRLSADFHVRVAWGPGEEQARDRILDLGGAMVHPLPPTNLLELSGWLHSADLVITTDSGPKHLAVSVGTPTLTLFGSTDPAGWQPPGQDHSWLTRPVDCHPCNLTECPVAGHPCLDELEPAEVEAAARELLQRGGQYV